MIDLQQVITPLEVQEEQQRLKLKYNREVIDILILMSFRYLFN